MVTEEVAILYEAVCLRSENRSPAPGAHFRSRLCPRCYSKEIHVKVRLTGLLAAAMLTSTGACDPSAPGETVDGESMGRDCHSAVQDVSFEEQQLADHEEATPAFVEDTPQLRGAEFRDGRIVQDGQRIGTFTMETAPAGGVYVASAEWCP
jgi:hypothetical protein